MLRQNPNTIHFEELSFQMHIDIMIHSFGISNFLEI